MVTSNILDIDSLLYIEKEQIDKQTHILARYYIESTTDLAQGAKAIALGQSIGPMHIRTKYESEELFKDYGAKIVGNKLSGSKGIVEIAFPAHNIDPETDGITQLFCTLAGGLYDIEILDKVRLLDFEVPDAWASAFPGPKFGMKGIREYLGVHDRPLLGGIIKPKTGLSPELVGQMCYEIALGGVDFIKEDEILGNPAFCRMEERVPIVVEYLKRAEQETGEKTLYAPCLTVDVKHLRDHARKAVALGANALHFNIYSGLSSYRMIAEDDEVNVPIYVQRSGDMAYTKDPYHGIHFGCICRGIRMVGGDFTHAGMYGGYIATPPDILQKYLSALRDPFHGMKICIPGISGGGHPGLVDITYNALGKDMMFTIGGGIMGHPQGLTAGAQAMRQAIDAAVKGIDVEAEAREHEELDTAIKKWGVVRSL